VTLPLFSPQFTIQYFSTQTLPAYVVPILDENRQPIDFTTAISVQLKIIDFAEQVRIVKDCATDIGSIAIQFAVGELAVLDPPNVYIAQIVATFDDGPRVYQGELLVYVGY
jgi:hypothetical protein